MRRKQSAYMWIFLAVIFLFLALDEFSSIHEKLGAPVRELLNASGAFYWAWIIPYGVLLVILAIIYARFIIELPAKPRRFMLISAFVYVTGALGFEMLDGWYLELHKGQEDLIYSLISTFEESLEMIGLLTFVYALMIYIEESHNGLTIQIGTSKSKSTTSNHPSEQTSENGSR